MTQMMAMAAVMAAHPEKFDPAAFSTLLPRLAPAYGVILPLSLACNAVLYAAMNRIVLRPADDAAGYLRLGVAELRQLGLQVLLGLLFFGLYVLAVFVCAGLIAMARGVGALLAVLTAAVSVCGLVFLGVRLSLASPATFQTARIDLAASWSLTKGRFWPILGTYLLAFVLVIVVVVLAGIVTGVVAILVSQGAGASAPAAGEVFTLAALSTPAQWVPMVLNAAVGALMWPVFLTPPAAIYQQLIARYGAGAAEAFS